MFISISKHCPDVLLVYWGKFCLKLSSRHICPLELPLGQWEFRLTQADHRRRIWEWLLVFPCKKEIALFLSCLLRKSPWLHLWPPDISQMYHISLLAVYTLEIPSNCWRAVKWEEMNLRDYHLGLKYKNGICEQNVQNLPTDGTLFFRHGNVKQIRIKWKEMSLK